MTDSPPPPAGWYPNPDAPGLKYWDGTQWTTHTAPETSLGASPGGPPPGTPGTPPGAPGIPSYPSYGSGPGWGQSGGYDQPYSRRGNDSNTLSIIGIVCGVIAVLFCPILFGPAGLVMGFVAVSKGEKLGWVSVGVAGAGMLLGFLFGFLIFSSMYSV